MSLKKWISYLTMAALLLAPLQSFAELSSSATATSITQDQLKSVSGYKLLKTTYSKELSANVYEYEHIKSGGRVVYVAANDSHKVMDIIVKTPSGDQTGANHVLEHGLLSGSEKYPTKAPFNTVNSTSVNTFANAMTYNDRTVFTFSTENDKDFDNLKRVYLDGIFAPKLLKDSNIFKREGWRYQYDAKGELGYTGVVYSEMMGMYSNPEVIHSQGIYEALYPNTTYANDSGGVPEKIVNLSPEQLRNVYKKYYQPSNMLVYYYGNVNLPAELKFLDQNYWSKYSKRAVSLNFGTAASPSKTVSLKNQYHVDKLEVDKDATLISMNYMLPANMSKKDRLGLNLLLYFLVRSDTAPLYADFVEADLGSQFSGYSDVANRYPMVTLSMRAGSSADSGAFADFLESSFNYYANEGINPEQLKSELKYMNLNEKLKMLSASKGNNIRESLELGYSTFGDPLYFFDNSALETEILKEAQNGDYFQKLIKNYLLGAKRSALVITEPKQGLNDLKYKALNQQLKDKYNKLSTADKKKLSAEIEAFKLWNNTADKPEALSKLPMLKLSDIQYKLPSEPKQEEAIGSAKLYTYGRETGGLTDLSFYFDISNLSEQEKLDLLLLQSFFLNMPTRNKPVKEMVETMSTYTNGLSTDSLILTGDNGYDLSAQRFYVNTTFQNEDSAQVLAVLNELFNYQRFDSKPFVKYVADEVSNRLVASMTSELDDIAYGNFVQYMTPTGAQYAKSLSSEAAYQYFKGISQNIDADYPKILKRLIAVYDKVFCSDNLIVSVATNNSQVDASQRMVKDFVSKLRKNGLSVAKMPQAAEFASLNQGPVKEAIIAPTQVAYIYKGFNLHQFDESFKGSYLVFAQLINNQYAHQELREKNGAYGGYFSAQADGSMFFASYRDPALLQSLKSMDEVVNWLKNLKLNQQELDPIIVALVGQLNQPENVLVKVDTDLQSVIAGRTAAEREKLIQEVLSTKPEDLNAFIAILEKGLSQSNTVVVGSEKQIQDQAGLFDKIRTLLK